MRDGKRIPSAAQRNPVDVRREHRDRLEEQVVTRFSTAASKGWFEMFSPTTALGRWTLAGLLLVGLGIGACEMPTESRVELGKQITLSIPPDGHEVLTYDDPVELTRDTAHRIESMPGVDGLNVEVAEGVHGETVLSFLIRGDDVPMHEILEMLREDLEPLNGVDIDVSDFGTMLHEDWGDKIGREIFHVKVDLGLDDGELQHVLLRALEEDGQPNATVEVQTQNGQRTITINRIGPDGLHETEDTMTLEVIREN